MRGIPCAHRYSGGVTRDLVDSGGASLDEAARYALSGGVRFEWTVATRHDGRDMQLGRPIRAWVLPATTHGSHEALLALAGASSRLRSPAFLRVVDAIPEADRLVVILEAPEPPHRTPATEEATEGTDGWDHTRDALLGELAAGLREAHEAGLALQRLPARLFESRTRLDPIELFLPATADTDEQPVGAQLHAAVIEAMARGTLPPGSPLRTLDLDAPGPESTPTDAADAVEAVLDALERATLRGGAPPLEWPPSTGEAGPFVSDEPTLPLAAPRAEAMPPPAAPTAPTAEAPPRAVTPAPAVRPRRLARQPGTGRTRLVALAAVGVLAAAGVLAVSAASLRMRSSAPPPEATTTAAEPAAPQAVPGQVLITLRAQEETFVRATVDGTVLFDGTLRSGESRSWQGRQRVQVFTNKGRTALISINGFELGPYSPAMGHPDWNQIDFGFGPDWRP